MKRLAQDGRLQRSELGMAKRRRGQARRGWVERLEERALLAASIGYVDVLNRTQVAGWAYDEDIGSTAMNVQINVDGATTNVRADQARQDLAFLGSIYHGFTFTMPTLNPGNHRVIVSFIDPVTGGLTTMTNQVVTNPPPRGYLDVKTSTQLVGWVYDSDVPTTALNVRVDVNGQTFGTTLANQARPDLAFTGSPNHGFTMAGDFTNKVVELVSFDQPTGVASVFATNNIASIGNVDGANQTEVVGWALDRNNSTASIQVRVDIDGVKGTPVTANVTRNDLTPFFGSANHGFRVALPTNLSAGEHQIKVYALDPDSIVNSDVLLFTGAVTNPGPRGWIDAANSTEVIGWALDTNAGQTPIQVQIKVDDAVVATVTANQVRSDLSVLGQGTSHGFRVALPTMSAGPHLITLLGQDAPSGAFVTITSTVVNNQPPVGSLDIVNNSVITGWAYDPDPNGAAKVRLYVDDVAYETMDADAMRSDLVPYLGSGDHGFTFNTPTVGFGEHTVRVMILDTFTQNERLLGTGKVTNLAPVGNIDVAQPTLVAGWAYDRDNPTAKLRVLFSIDGVVRAETIAQSSRPDLVPYIGSANHGYQFSFTGLAAGRHTFELFAVDPTGVSVSLGKRTVTA